MQKLESQQVLNLQVTDGLTVAVIQNVSYEFLMPVTDVAIGYGVSPGTIRSTQSRHNEEFIENVHFVKGVAFCNTLKNAQPHAIYWTKAGVIRLGMFIKSERAKMFRDWAEQIILAVTAPKVQLPLVHKRKHNRLSASRLLDIMADVARIEDSELRIRLVNKLMPDVQGVQLSIELGKGGAKC